MKHKGFTLIELLVVIAIIALLLAVILPSLRAAKELASGAVCVSNQRQLSTAWIAYTQDNDGFLVGGSNYYATGTWPYSTPYRWVEFPLFDDGDNPATPYNDNPPNSIDYSLQYRLNGIRAGALYPYTGDEDVYHCPGDRNHTKAEPEAIFRSYAIAGLMNGEDFISRENNNLYAPINQHRFLNASVMGGKELKVAVKYSQISSPGTKYVFVEEDISEKVPKQYVNAGGFVMLHGGNYTWWDWPAYYHNDSSTLGFADGHAERHRWQESATIELIKGEKPLSSFTAAELAQSEDLAYMVRGYIPIP